MGESFDPYEVFLQIPLDRRPPTAEDLLGLRGTRYDQECVQQAFQERFEHVRKYVLSDVGPHAQRLLNELAQAATVLKWRLQATASALGDSPAQSPLAVEARDPSAATSRVSESTHGGAGTRGNAAMWVAASGALTIVVVGLLLFFALPNARTTLVGEAHRGAYSEVTVGHPIGPRPVPSRSVGGEVVIDLGSGVKLEMVLIPSGDFSMGSPDSNEDGHETEKPYHRVRISRPFYLGKYEVTQEQWDAVMGKNPSYFKASKNPVEGISWDDCQAFLAKLNDRSGTSTGRFCLPTEAQWEYVCRAGSIARYCFGDGAPGLKEYAWYDANSEGKTHTVGLKRPNGWGLYDMHGNVWEWCADWYAEDYYRDSPSIDPLGPASGRERVLRGGAWFYLPETCRSAYRSHFASGFRHFDLGLRVARSVDP